MPSRWKQLISDIDRGLFYGLTAFLLIVGIGCAAGGRSLVLTGYVQTLRTDERDNPAEIAIWDGRTEYRVNPEGEAAEKLFDLQDRKVAVKGVVHDESPGKGTVDVESFQLLD